MRSVVVFWFRDGAALWRQLPIREVVDHATRHGFLDRELHFVCLGGDDGGCVALRESLTPAGARFHDLRRERDAIAASFPWLRQRMGKYFDCFLRWLVIEEFAAGEPVLSWDADIFLNAPLSAAHALLEGVTGTASSTCFTAISDRAWFVRYRSELERLEQQRDDYLRGLDRDYRALHQAGRLGGAEDSDFGRRIAAEIVARGRALAIFDSTPEEIFVDRLVRTGALPQTWFLRRGGYLVVPQLLTLPDLCWVTGAEHRVHEPLAPPLRLTRIDGAYRINGEPLLFVHFQGAVFRLCAAHWVRSRRTAAATLSLPPLKSSLHPGDRAGQNAEEILRGPETKGLDLSEAAIARRFMLEGALTEVLNPDVSDHTGLWA